jgi:D-amino peptidase
VTSSQITEAATAAMASAGRGEGVVAPHRIEVEFDATHLADAAAVVPTVELIGPRRVGFDAVSMTEAMKAFKIVTHVAAGAIEGIYG